MHKDDNRKSLTKDGDGFAGKKSFLYVNVSKTLFVVAALTTFGVLTFFDVLSFTRSSTVGALLNMVISVGSVMAAEVILDRSRRKWFGLKSERVIRAPGTLARTVLSFVFSKRAFETVFGQAIVDMQEEYVEALANGKKWKARWVVVRDHIGLLLTVGTYIGTTVVKRAVGIWKMIP